jgi:hypothetical protein
MSIRISILFIFVVQLAFGQESAIVRPFEQGQLKQFPNVRDFTISADGVEAYFSAQSPLGELSTIMRIKYERGNWQAPELVAFSGQYMDIEAFLSPDGLQLYFASDRPLDKDSDEPKDFDIWYVQRANIDAEWSEPVNIGSPINTEHNEFFPSISINKNMYFTSNPPESKGKDDIYFAAWEDGVYAKAVSMSDSINSEGYEFNAYIAPDESFLIYSGYNRVDGQGSGDLYISYQKSDSTWSNAINLGPEINSGQMDYCPFVNLQTGTLYFTSRRSELGILRERFDSAEDFFNKVTSYENGFSRIYEVDFTEFLPDKEK